MTTVHRVIAQIRRPVGTDPGQVSDGFYTVTDGVLTLTAPDGSPLIKKDGTALSPHRHVLKPGDDAQAIAITLTRKARRELLGLSEEQEAFGRRLNYGPLGVA